MQRCENAVPSVINHIIARLSDEVLENWKPKLGHFFSLIKPEISNATLYLPCKSNFPAK
jgi:hypothetical protein